MERGDWQRMARRGLVLVLWLAAGGVLAAQAASFALDGEIGARLLLSYDPNVSPSLDAAVSDSLLLLRLRALGGWTFYSRATLSYNQFTFLALGADGRIGPVDSRAQVVFNPSADDLADRFRYLSWLMSWRIGDLRFGNTLFLTGASGHSYDQLAVRAAVAGLTWNGFVRFLIETCDTTTGPRPMMFNAAQLRLDTLLFSCGIPIQAKLVVSETGFETFEVFVRGIPLGFFSALALETTLDLHLEFGATDKQVEPMLRTHVGSVCAGIQPYIELVDDGFPRIDGIDVYGIEFSCAIGEAAEIRSATCFDPKDSTHNRTVTGETEYFERLSLSSLLPGCCGVPAEWGLDVYFERDASSLFGWGRIDAGVFVPLGSRWFGSFEAEFERSGAWLVSIGFSARF